MRTFSFSPEPVNGSIHVRLLVVGGHPLRVKKLPSSLRVQTTSFYEPEMPPARIGWSVWSMLRMQRGDRAAAGGELPAAASAASGEGAGGGSSPAENGGDPSADGCIPPEDGCLLLGELLKHKALQGVTVRRTHARMCWV